VDGDTVGAGSDFASTLSSCLQKRCELSKIQCQSIIPSELQDKDTLEQTIVAWTKPNKVEKCKSDVLKKEFISDLETPTPCWSKWYGSRQTPKSNEVKLDDLSEELKKLAPKMKIDSKIRFYQSLTPKSFINAAYCYLIFQKVTQFSNLPINQFPFAAQATSFGVAKANEYRDWLKHTEQGKTCHKLVTLFSGNPPHELASLAEGKKFVVIVNPIGCLSGGTHQLDDVLKVNFNHERLHVVFAEDNEIREKVKREWSMLSSTEQRAFKEKHTSYNFGEEQILLREYFSYKHQDNVEKF
jgi:hypothetical protein